MSDQHGNEQHTLQGQVQRAKRLREQIERLKSGRPILTPDHPKSLREQIDERAAHTRDDSDAAGRP